MLLSEELKIFNIILVSRFLLRWPFGSKEWTISWKWCGRREGEWNYRGIEIVGVKIERWKGKTYKNMFKKKKKKLILLKIKLDKNIRLKALKIKNLNDGEIEEKRNSYHNRKGRSYGKWKGKDLWYWKYRYLRK